MKRSSVHEQRLRDGDVRAARAVALDAVNAPGSNWLDVPFRGVELRAKPDGTGGERLLFTGYACVTEQPYEMWDWYGPYTEVVRTGAFDVTLSQGPDVAFLLNHAGATMARTKPGTMRLSVDDIGQHCEAQLDPSRSDVAIIRSGVEGGELDEMSMAFRVVRQMWSPDYDQRDLLELDLNKGDNSVVNYGANDGTAGYPALRARQASRVHRSSACQLLADTTLPTEARSALWRHLAPFLAEDLAAAAPERPRPGTAPTARAAAGVDTESPAAAPVAGAELDLDFVRLIASAGRVI